MQEQIDSHNLKITGEVELPHALDLGTEYKLTVTGSIKSISKEDDEDGSYSYTYKFPLLLCELIDKTGKATKLKDKTKSSVKLRMAIKGYKAIKGIEGDDEIFYSRVMSAISDYENLEWIIEKLKI